jgi:glutamyl-tRNA synthetase
LAEKHFTAQAREALAALEARLAALPEWEKGAIGQAIKDVMKEHGLKMPQVAIPLRVVLLGVEQSPSIDAVLEVLGHERTLQRLARLG